LKIQYDLLRSQIHQKQSEDQSQLKQYNK